MGAEQYDIFLSQLLPQQIKIQLQGKFVLGVVIILVVPECGRIEDYLFPIGYAKLLLDLSSQGSLTFLFQDIVPWVSRAEHLPVKHKAAAEYVKGELIRCDHIIPKTGLGINIPFVSPVERRRRGIVLHIKGKPFERGAVPGLKKYRALPFDNVFGLSYVKHKIFCPAHVIEITDGETLDPGGRIGEVLLLVQDPDIFVSARIRLVQIFINIFGVVRIIPSKKRLNDHQILFQLHFSKDLAIQIFLALGLLRHHPAEGLEGTVSPYHLRHSLCLPLHGALHQPS